MKFLMYVKLHYFQIYQVTQNGSMWTCWTSTVPEFSWSQQSLEGFKEIVQLFSSQEKSFGKQKQKDIGDSLGNQMEQEMKVPTPLFATGPYYVNYLFDQ
jgi:hypothetical protein